MRFSQTELRDLAVAWVLLSLAFGYVFLGSGVFSLSGLMLSLLIAGSGFVIHELAHKFTAQAYRCFAEFRADYRMLGAMLLFAYLGFVFAAPGAVLIQGRVNAREYGLIAAAGPLSNIVLAVLFFVAGLFVSPLASIASLGVQLNAFLAVFNMIPFGPLDGAKVLRWSPRWWVAITALGALPFFFV